MTRNTLNHCLKFTFVLFPAIFATEKFQKKFSTRSSKLNFWCPRHQIAASKAWISFNALSFSQVVKIPNKFTHFHKKYRKFTCRLNSKISVTGTSCWTCQQLRLIFSSRSHRISIRLHMQDHNIPLSLFVISVYIFNCISSVKYLFKRSHHGHVIAFFCSMTQAPSPKKNLKGWKSTNV